MGHLRGTAEIWNLLCLLSGKGGTGGCWSPPCQSCPLVLGTLIVIFLSRAPQRSICTVAATFVLLTQSLAPWVLLSAQSFRNVP